MEGTCLTVTSCFRSYLPTCSLHRREMEMRSKPIPKLSDSDLIRFIRTIRFGRKCWDWQGNSRNGYGDFSIKNKVYRAHRISYELFTQEVIPLELVIDHLCDNKACVKPTHLKVTTHRENILRGTSFSAIHARKTHCFRGHEFNEENTYKKNGIGRECRVCKRELMRKYRLVHGE